MSEADPVLRLLGLAARAGAVVPGTGRVRSAAIAGQLRFAIVASDASGNSRAKLLPVLVERSVAHVVSYDRGRLGEAVGRAPLSAVGLTSRSFAEGVKAKLASRGTAGN